MKLFIIAGEASGDQLGAKLLADARRLAPDLEVRGIGGAEMAGQGVESLFPMQELSLMGLAEVLPKIPSILKRLNDTVNAVYEFCGISAHTKMSGRSCAGVCAPAGSDSEASQRPHDGSRHRAGITDNEGGGGVTVLTIDIPDFSKRLARRLQPLRRAGQVRLVHYVAPTVWAWRPGRAKKMAALFNHLLCLYPFEPPYFEREGLCASFVGHPIAKDKIAGDAGRLRARLGIHDDQPVICLLPGSRAGEVKRLLPVFLRAFEILKKQIPDLVALLPTLPHLQGLIPQQKDIYILSQEDKYSAFSLAARQGAALAASGTVSLELAAAGCAHLVAYKMNPLTYWLARIMIKIPFVNLINILAGRGVVPEYLQDAATPDALASAWLSVRGQAPHQQLDFAEQLEKLKPHEPDAAAKILATITNK